MGDHTDQTGGRVLPMAIDLGTTVRGRRRPGTVEVRSSWAGAQAADGEGAARSRRLVDELASRIGPAGFDGVVDTTLPVGAGLSSSASFGLAVALALGFDGSPHELAELVRDAERAATGVPTGIMDQLAVACGRAGHALRIDCHALEVTPVPFPDDLDVLVLHSGRHRTLAATPYAERVAELARAEAEVGPLRLARLDDVATLADPTVRRRARHVVTENGRVDAMAAALRSGDRTALAALLAESHASLRDDFEASSPPVEAAVAALRAVPGVLGARVTGAGWGGCVVALAEFGAALPEGWAGWRLRPADGATCAGGGRPSWPRTPRP